MLFTRLVAYFRGRLIRGELSIESEASPNRLPATCAEVLPTGTMKLKGVLSVAKRGLHIQVGDAKGEVQFITFCLFQASPPASVLAGLMFGTTVIGPDAQPSVTRIVMVRLPTATTARLHSADAYLPARGSIAKDLVGLGLHIDDPASADRLLAEFLSGEAMDLIKSRYRPITRSPNCSIVAGLQAPIERAVSSPVPVSGRGRPEPAMDQAASRLIRYRQEVVVPSKRS